MPVFYVADHDESSSAAVHEELSDQVEFQQPLAPTHCTSAHCRNTVSQLRLKIRQLQRKAGIYLTEN